MKTQNYLATADLAYKNLKEGQHIRGIDNVEYEVVKSLHTKSGYDGYVLYRKDTNELVVTHRGTWPEKNAKATDILTDLGMAVNQGNNQYPDAKKLTEIAISLTQTRYPGAVIHQSGHSLGGALAQLCGYNYGQQTETFNAYGAAKLNEKQPGKQSNAKLITNHVRGIDPVSSASPHLGNVKYYLHEGEKVALYLHGFGRFNTSPNRTWSLAIVGAAASHGLDNFKNGGLSAQSHSFASEHINLIKEFRIEFEADVQKTGRNIRFIKDRINDGIRWGKEALDWGKDAINWGKDAFNWGKKALNLSANVNTPESQLAQLITDSHLLLKENDNTDRFVATSSTATQIPQSKYDEVRGMLRGIINDTDGSYAQKVLAEHPEQVALFDEKIRQNIALNQDKQQELAVEKGQTFQHEEQQRTLSRSFG